MPRTFQLVGARLGLPRNLFSAMCFIMSSLCSGELACSGSPCKRPVDGCTGDGLPRASQRVGASLGLPRNLFSPIGFLISCLFSGARACSASALGSFCDWRAHWSASPKQAEQDSQALSSAACENRWPVRKWLGQARFKGRRPVHGCPGTCSQLFVL